MRRLGIIVVLIACSLSGADYSSLYRPFQRDIIFLIDWSSPLESLAHQFHASGANLDSGLGSVASTLAAALYNPSVPVIVSIPIWATILERAQFVADGNNLAQDAFISKYLTKYKNNADYKDTLLVNKDFLTRLYQFCRKSYDTYQKVNAALAQEFNKTNNLNTISWRVSEQFRDPSLAGFLKTAEDTKLWRGVNELLKCFVIVQKIQQEKDAWIFRQADSCIFIMVPQLYLDELKKRVVEFGQKIGMEKPLGEVLNDSMKDKQTERALTVDEIILGIKFDNFAPLDPFVIPKVVCQEKIGTALSDSFISKKGKAFQGILTRILINAEDFATFTQEKYLERSSLSWTPHYCVWNVYGLGHGSAPLKEQPSADDIFYIMGLRENAMVAFLDFFDSINTRFLFYTSCYAGGHRLRSLYIKQQQKEWARKRYHYTIVVGAMTQVVTTGVVYPFNVPPYKAPYGMIPTDINTKNRSLQPRFYPQFGQFFNDLHVLTRTDPKTGRKKPVTYREILLLIEDFTEPRYLSNVPQIRFAGSTWFNVIDLENFMVRLTEMYVRTKEAEITVAETPEEKKLVIKDKRLLLIDADPIWQMMAGPAHSEIPFEIVLQDSMPTVISMATGNAWHFFEKIDARQFGLIEVMQKFWGIAGTFYGRTYYIKELSVKNDLTQAAQIGALGQAVLTLKDVYILANAPDPRNYAAKQYLQGIIFSYNNKIFTSLFLLTDVGQVGNANAELRSKRLPYLQNVPGPIPGYQAIIEQAFPQEVIKGISREDLKYFKIDKNKALELIKQYKEKQKLGDEELEAWQKKLPKNEQEFLRYYEKKVPPSLEKVARFIIDRKKQVDLIVQYEKQKKAGQKPLELWKKMLTENEQHFIEYYEAMELAREPHVPTPMLLAQLDVELTALQKHVTA